MGPQLQAHNFMGSCLVRLSPPLFKQLTCKIPFLHAQIVTILEARDLNSDDGNRMAITPPLLITQSQKAINVPNVPTAWPDFVENMPLGSMAVSTDEVWILTQAPVCFLISQASCFCLLILFSANLAFRRDWNFSGRRVVASRPPVSPAKKRRRPVSGLPLLQIPRRPPKNLKPPPLPLEFVLPKPPKPQEKAKSTRLWRNLPNNLSVRPNHPHPFGLICSYHFSPSHSSSSYQSAFNTSPDHPCTFNKSS
jgi:hypothetical protein